MNKITNWRRALVLGALGLSLTTFAAGCSNSAAPTASDESHEGHDHAEGEHKDDEK